MGKKHRKTAATGSSVKGLLVGINYRGTRNQLGGCINDALAMQRLIMSTYPNANLELLTDDTPEKPTRNNILTKLKNLIANSKAGDTLIFDYSGHGSQVPDIHGDEEDGMDETICPIDFMTPRTIMYNGRQLRVDSQITDDEINEIITELPHGAKFLMLSDSCHSGTIGDLKNDFMHYQGPAVWGDEEQLSSNSSSQPSIPYLPHQQQQSYASSQLAAPSITCRASWIYILLHGKKELWLTPLDVSLYEEFGHKKAVIQLVSMDLPVSLLNHPNRPQIVNTTFKKLANGQYDVSSVELGIENVIIKPSARSITNRELSYQSQQLMPRFSELPVSRDLPHPCEVSSHYDPVTGKHHHVHHLTGKKRTLNMRSPNSCNGGELRIISGCQEDETSADTGQNGACTMAFLETVKLIGGLPKFFDKLFSHNVEDLKLLQDKINQFLSRFGFTQHSVLSWDHAHAERALAEALSNYGYNPTPLYRSVPSYSERPVLYSYPAITSQRQSFDSYYPVTTSELTYSTPRYGSSREQTQLYLEDRPYRTVYRIT